MQPYYTICNSSDLVLALFLLVLVFVLRISFLFLFFLFSLVLLPSSSSSSLTILIFYFELFANLSVFLVMFLHHILHWIVEIYLIFQY